MCCFCSSQIIKIAALSYGEDEWRKTTHTLKASLFVQSLLVVLLRAEIDHVKHLQTHFMASIAFKKNVIITSSSPPGHGLKSEYTFLYPDSIKRILRPVQRAFGLAVLLVSGALSSEMRKFFNSPIVIGFRTAMNFLTNKHQIVKSGQQECSAVLDERGVIFAVRVHTDQNKLLTLTSLRGVIQTLRLNTEKLFIAEAVRRFGQDCECHVKMLLDIASYDPKHLYRDEKEQIRYKPFVDACQNLHSLQIRAGTETNGTLELLDEEEVKIANDVEAQLAYAALVAQLHFTVGAPCRAIDWCALTNGELGGLLSLCQNTAVLRLPIRKDASLDFVTYGLDVSSLLRLLLFDNLFGLPTQQSLKGFSYESRLGEQFSSAADITVTASLCRKIMSLFVTQCYHQLSALLSKEASNLRAGAIQQIGHSQSTHHGNAYAHSSSIMNGANENAIKVSDAYRLAVLGEAPFSPTLSQMPNNIRSYLRSSDVTDVRQAVRANCTQGLPTLLHKNIMDDALVILFSSRVNIIVSRQSCGFGKSSLYCSEAALFLQLFNKRDKWIPQHLRLFDMRGRVPFVLVVGPTNAMLRALSQGSVVRKLFGLKAVLWTDRQVEDTVPSDSSLIFVAPETFDTPSFRYFWANSCHYCMRVYVDEYHTAIEAGSYRFSFSRLCDAICQQGSQRVPICLMSGSIPSTLFSLSLKVLQINSCDIERAEQIQGMDQIIPQPSALADISKRRVFSVMKCETLADSLHHIASLVHDKLVSFAQSKVMIVCATIDQVMVVKEHLNSFHCDLGHIAAVTSTHPDSDNLAKWLDTPDTCNRCRVLVCTSILSTGTSNDSCDLVISVHGWSLISSVVQAAFRAGRGHRKHPCRPAPAHVLVFLTSVKYNDDDFSHFQALATTEEMKIVRKCFGQDSLRSYATSNACRNVYLSALMDEPGHNFEHNLSIVSHRGNCGVCDVCKPLSHFHAARNSSCSVPPIFPLPSIAKNTTPSAAGKASSAPSIYAKAKKIIRPPTVTKALCGVRVRTVSICPPTRPLFQPGGSANSGADRGGCHNLATDPPQCRGTFGNVHSQMTSGGGDHNHWNLAKNTPFNSSRKNLIVNFFCHLCVQCPFCHENDCPLTSCTKYLRLLGFVKKQNHCFRCGQEQEEHKKDVGKPICYPLDFSTKLCPYCCITYSSASGTDVATDISKAVTSELRARHKQTKRRRTDKHQRFTLQTPVNNNLNNVSGKGNLATPTELVDHLKHCVFNNETTLFRNRLLVCVSLHARINKDKKKIHDRAGPNRCRQFWETSNSLNSWWSSALVMESVASLIARLK